LARDWLQWHPHSLDHFCSAVYQHIAARLADLPEHAHPAMTWMAHENWLGSYADLDGIADVLQRMSRRARQPNPLAGGEQAFRADAAGFADDFVHWYADAQAFVTQWQLA
jgi:acyl carrier protein phosphodiesterase